MLAKVNWTKDEKEILGQTIMNCLIEGKDLHEGFKEVAKKINRPEGTCENFWYSFIKYDYSKELKELEEARITPFNKPKRNWMEYEEHLLMACIKECEEKGHNIGIAFDHASRLLKRTYGACTTRWHQKIEPFLKYIERD